MFYKLYEQPKRNNSFCPFVVADCRLSPLQLHIYIKNEVQLEYHHYTLQEHDLVSVWVTHTYQWYEVYHLNLMYDKN